MQAERRLERQVSVDPEELGGNSKVGIGREYRHQEPQGNQQEGLYPKITDRFVLGVHQNQVCCDTLQLISVQIADQDARKTTQ